MTPTKKREVEIFNFGTQLPFNELSDPGTYMIVTRLSTDPYCPISKARMIAADLDLEVNF